MAMLSDCSGQYSAEEIEQAEKLAEHRWQRYLACTDVPQPSPAGRRLRGLWVQGARAARRDALE